jgi:hypothetical protein
MNVKELKEHLSKLPEHLPVLLSVKVRTGGHAMPLNELKARVVVASEKLDADIKRAYDEAATMSREVAAEACKLSPEDQHAYGLWVVAWHDERVAKARSSMRTNGYVDPRGEWL